MPPRPRLHHRLYALRRHRRTEAGNAHAYVVWLFVLDTPPTVARCCSSGGGRSSTRSARTGFRGCSAAALSLIAYWIVIWAFTVAPIPIVAALRETSIFSPR